MKYYLARDIPTYSRNDLRLLQYLVAHSMRPYIRCWYPIPGSHYVAYHYSDGTTVVRDRHKARVTGFYE